jgi:hypothetical protein
MNVKHNKYSPHQDPQETAIASNRRPSPQASAGNCHTPRTTMPSQATATNHKHQQETTTRRYKLKLDTSLIRDNRTRSGCGHIQNPAPYSPYREDQDESSDDEVPDEDQDESDDEPKPEKPLKVYVDIMKPYLTAIRKAFAEEFARRSEKRDGGCVAVVPSQSVDRQTPKLMCFGVYSEP